ncbi:hypothetical protein PV11_02760 [Exophiala sideris]|uniref:C2H2-type domain-containing protein n=1 Tax=Exophiala sideris TaxID=1016849 RepID=A0A0D1ZK69_9EURO|nr:hypothetical protein PV11_02760 [Exophiala sideris]
MDRSETVVDLNVAKWLETKPNSETFDASEHELDHSETAHDSGIVTALYQSCQAQLSRLSAILASPSRRRRLFVTDIRTKLVIFGGSLEDGKLESFLNADDELKDDILLILYEIGTILAYDVFQGASKDLIAFRDDDTSTRLRDLLASAKAALDTESGSDTSEDSSASEDGKRSSDSGDGRKLEQQCLRLLARNVDLLMTLYPTLEQAFRDKHRRPRARLPWAMQKFSVTSKAWPYVHNVRDKFPLAANDLAERLGEVNWQRHRRLRAIKTPEIMGSEKPKSVFKPISEFRDSALGDSLASKSAKAVSVASHSSYMSSNEGGDKQHFRVPNLPAGASYGRVFACPYCEEEVSMRNRIDWKMHVFEDLQAWICTHPECPEGSVTFPSRRKWFEHEEKCHMTAKHFRCTQRECHMIFQSQDSFLSHARFDHSISVETPAVKWSILNAATISTLQPVDGLQCPLCQTGDWITYRSYEKHLGKHQEEIALCALPPSNEGDDDDEEDEDGGEGERADDAASSVTSEGAKALGQKNDRDSPTDREYVSYNDLAEEIAWGSSPSLNRPIASPHHEDIPNEVEYTIKCICRYADDDGNTVYCPKCNTWQHIDCYYHGQKVPEEHFCADCLPQNLDAKKATERQRKLREELRQNSNLKKALGNQRYKSHKAKVKKRT